MFSRAVSTGLWILISFIGVASAKSEVRARILETDPPAPATLGKMEWLNIHVSYTSDEEVLFSPDSYFRGKRAFDERHFLTSGFRPAGAGDAAVAIAFESSSHVDEVRVVMWGRSGRLIGETSIPVNVNWTGHASAARRQTADWARSLESGQSDQAQRMAAKASWTWGEILWGIAGGLLMYASIPAYLVLQAIGLWSLRNDWLKAAVLPLIPMALVVVYTIDAYLKESNLWPVILILASPIAAVYLLAVLTMHRGRKRQLLNNQPSF